MGRRGTDLNSKHRLLLDAALAEPDAAVRSFSRWWSEVDFEDMQRQEYRLLPLVYHNIGRRIEDRGAAARIRGIAKHVWLSNQRTAAACTTTLDELIALDVPTLLLKGAAMMVAVSGESLRLINDCDILVPIERAPQVLASLLGLGHEAPYQSVHRFTAADFRSTHGVSLAPIRDAGVPLDIHWRPLREVGADALTREFFDRSVRCRFLGRPTRRPSFEHMLLHTALHGTAWDELPRYDWLADAVLILRKAGDGFDWRQFAETVNRFGLGSIMDCAMRDLSRLTDAPVPLSTLRLSRGHLIDRVEARWRRADPAARPAARVVAAVQSYRRRSPFLAQRPAWAAMPDVWRDIAGPPAPGLVRSGASDTDDIVFLRGWSYPEAVGRWTDGRLASLAICRAGGGHGTALRLVTRPIHPASDLPQSIDVYSNWRRIARLRWPAGDDRVRTDFVALPAALRNRDMLALQFHIRRPVVPPALGPGTDLRRLGLFLLDIGYWPCVRDAAARPIELRDGSSDQRVLGSGWSVPESEGCWTEGHEAVLGWIAPRDLPPGAHIVLTAASVFAPGPEALTGHVTINGRRSGQLLVPPGNFGSLEISVPLSPPDLEKREIDLRIHVDNPRSPREAGMSNDPRRLGLFVKSVRVDS